MNEETEKTNNSSVPITDMECTVQPSQDAASAHNKDDTRVSVHVHSIRRRLVDPDGISAKAVIDGLVRAGLLKDDSIKYVKEVTYSQEACDRKTGTEETIIELWEEA